MGFDGMQKRSMGGLQQHGLYNLNEVFWNLPTPALYEHVNRRREGAMSHLGPLVVRTGHHTGRSADDKFIVDEVENRDLIWWGTINKPIPEQNFDILHQRMASYLQMKDVYVQDGYAGADPAFRMPIRIITEYAWHSVFARDLFIQPDPDDLVDHEPYFMVIDSPRFHAIPTQDHTRSETFILVNFHQRLVLIGGTSYAGEIKKSIFSVVNFLMTDKGVLPMRCSANFGPDGKTALFDEVSDAIKLAAPAAGISVPPSGIPDD